MTAPYDVENMLNRFGQGILEQDNSKLRDLRGKSILLYGAGNIGKRLYRTLKEVHIHVVGFIDRDSALDPNDYPIPVYQPESDQLLPLKNSAYVILSALFPNNICQEIKEFLSKLSFTNVFSLDEVNFALITKSSYYERNFDNTFARLDILGTEKNSIIQACSLLAEEDDRRLFAEQLTAHLTMDFTRLRKPHAMRFQYTGHDIQKRKDYSNFIDCGAFDGDTIRLLLAQGAVIRNLIAFEPQNNLYHDMVDYVQSKPDTFETAYIVPCGVYSETKTVPFAACADSPSAGKLDGTGRNIIQCVRIDDAIHGFHPTFIKMDIEGAELEALKGAKETIIANTPQMAICVYHTLSHLWKILLLIKDYYSGYTFYLKNYNYMGMETVLYAFPD